MLLPAFFMCYRFLRSKHPFLVISRVFYFLCFTTTHSPHSYVFSYFRVFIPVFQTGPSCGFRPRAEAQGKPRSLARGERKSLVVALQWDTRHKMGTINEKIRLTKDMSYMLETIKMIIPLICNHVIVLLELFACKLICHKSLFCFSPSNHIYLFAN